jgi:peptide/nickel transport system ATP-binding protein
MLMRTERLGKVFSARGRDRGCLAAVEDVTLSIPAGKTIGLTGDSGSGKSTLGKMIAGLLKPTSGALFWEDRALVYPVRGRLRGRIQILFQHPEVSFNPELPLISSLREPYRLMGERFSKPRLLEDIGRFGLHEEHLTRLPRQLSGGELQRAALSRVLTLKPDLIVLDEPTSMLDVISQAQILYYLKEHQRLNGTAYLLITHDLALAGQVCDETHRLADGRLER